MKLGRRGFLGLLAGAAAGAAVVDPEELLWTPGAKKIFIPPAPVLSTTCIDSVSDEELLMIAQYTPASETIAMQIENIRPLLQEMFESSEEISHMFKIGDGLNVHLMSRRRGRPRGPRRQELRHNQDDQPYNPLRRRDA